MTVIRMRPAVLKEVRGAFRDYLPGTKAGVIDEAVARGLGYSNHGNLRAEIRYASTFALFCYEDFRDHLILSSDIPPFVNLLALEDALTPLYGEDIQPSCPKDMRPSPPWDWSVIMVAAVNGGIRRGLFDVEPEFDNPLKRANVLSFGSYIFNVGSSIGHCTYTEQPDYNIKLEVTVDMVTSSTEDPIKATGILDRMDGIWLSFEGEDVFSLHPTQQKALDQIDIERPLGFGPGVSYEILRARRETAAMHDALMGIAQEVEEDFRNERERPE
jgi:hypothetical protein